MNDGKDLQSLPESEAPTTENPEQKESAVSKDAPVSARPSYLFLALVSGLSLAADLATKAWALHALEKKIPSGDGAPTPIELTSWLSFILARNRGGAWGLLQTASESVRRPFFLVISVAAIIFIVSLYRRVHPNQRALRWGLPLVLGGALGNLIDRIRYSWVVDFIDYKSTWVHYLNQGISKLFSSHVVTDHWPTFNVADVVIVVGVGLMAIDMFTVRRPAHRDSQAVKPAQ
jgi:signal peptidase II